MSGGSWSSRWGLLRFYSFVEAGYRQQVTWVPPAERAMMAIGLLTRIAALVQIPILLGAVFLVHFQGGLFAASKSFAFFVLVLFLLVLVFLYGSGRWSADYYIDRQQSQKEAEYMALLRQKRTSRSGSDSISPTGRTCQLEGTARAPRRISAGWNAARPVPC